MLTLEQAIYEFETRKNMEVTGIYRNDSAFVVESHKKEYWLVKDNTENVIIIIEF